MILNVILKTKYDFWDITKMIFGGHLHMGHCNVILNMKIIILFGKKGILLCKTIM